jgi:hypothetical protein
LFHKNPLNELQWILFFPFWKKLDYFFLWKKLVKHKKKIKKLKNCLRDNHIEAFLSVKWLSNFISFSVLKSTSWIGGKKNTYCRNPTYGTNLLLGNFASSSM